MSTRTTTAQREFGRFLRSRREKLDPAAVGLNGTRRRRTPGLRREEVAERAGIGVDWYVRLEQGRIVSPSDATLDAVSDALHLGQVDRAHLRALALKGRAFAQKDRSQPFARESVPETVARLVAGMDHPAYVTGRRWDVLTWNAAAAELLGFDTFPAEDRNILVFMFTMPVARTLFGESWEEEARRMIALFRTTYDLWADDPAFVELVERLQKDSAAFATGWASHDVRGGASGEKRLHHPSRGVVRYAYATFQANDDPALKLALYTPL